MSLTARSADAKKDVVIVPDKDADGLSAGAILRHTLVLLGLPKDLIALLRFTAEHYRYPLGEVIRGALPPGLSTAVDEKEAKPDIQFWALLVLGKPSIPRSVIPLSLHICLTSMRWQLWRR